MKSLKLFGLALGATFALSASAFAQDITVAVAGPMTGSESAFGRQLKNGAEQAVADINAAGGILGKKLALETDDDACDPKQARSIAEKIASSKIPFVPGISARRPRSRRRKPMPTATSCRSRRPRPTRCSPNASSGTWRASAAATISRASSPPTTSLKNYKGKNVAILNDKTTYGKGLADETKKALNKAGFQEKMFESYNKGDKDFNSIVSRLKRDNIDLVYVGGYHQEAGLILRQMRDQGLQTVLMAGDAMNDKEFASITGPAAEGTLFTFGPTRATSRPRRRSSRSSKPRTSTPRATRSTPTPRCRSGRRPPPRPAPPTPRR
jgi:branched-chain amino acid transport system substrate-binding protein